MGKLLLGTVKKDCIVGPHMLGKSHPSSKVKITFLVSSLRITQIDQGFYL